MARRNPKPASAPAEAASPHTPEPTTDTVPAEQPVDAAAMPSPAGDDPAPPPQPAAQPSTEPRGQEAGSPAEPEAAKPAYGPNPFGIRGDGIAGVRLLEDRRFRQMQLKFVEKPSDAVRQVVRDAGFQWRSADQVWSKPIDPDQGWRTRAAAEELFKQVAAMIREERGLGLSREADGEGVPF